MKLYKYFAALFVFLYISNSTVFAQKPDTATYKEGKYRWPKAFVKTKDGLLNQGFMAYYFPYAPEKTVSLIPLTGGTKKAQDYRVKDIESISYADMKYSQVLADNDVREYLAREAVSGPLNLYIYTEQGKVPVIIPVAGLARALMVPYDNSLFFIEKDYKTIRINRETYQKQMLEYVGENPELAKKIKDKTYKYKDTETIIKEYNAWAAANK